MADIARTILTGGNIGGLLGTTGDRDLRARSLLGLGSGLLAAAGPQPVAPSLGQAMSMGLKEMQQARTAYSNEQLQKMQMEKLKAETEKLLTDEAEEMIWVYDETLEKKIQIPQSDFDPEIHRKEAPAEIDKMFVWNTVDDDWDYIEKTKFDPEIHTKEAPKEVEEIWVYHETLKKKILIKPENFNSTFHRKEEPTKEEKVEDIWVYSDEKGHKIRIQPDDFDPEQHRKEAPPVDEYKEAADMAAKYHPITDDMSDEEKQSQEEKRQIFIANKLGVKDPHEVEESRKKNLITDIDLQLKNIEVDFAKENKILNLDKLKLDIANLENIISFDDTANLLKIQKLTNQVESIELNNQALIMENENAPLINQLEIEGMQLDNLKKSIGLETFGDHQEELLANMQLKNEKLMNELKWYDTDMQSKIRKRNIEIDKLIYDRDNPPMDYEKIRTESTLRKEFNNLFEVTQMREMKTMYDKVNISAKEDSAAGDISLVFAYMKMLDPRSTVREGEAATVRGARSVPEGITNLYNELIKTGEKLTQKQRDSFVKASKSLMAGTIENYKPVYESYVDIAERKKLEVEDVVIDYESMYPNINISIEATTTLDINPKFR